MLKHMIVAGAITTGVVQTNADVLYGLDSGRTLIIIDTDTGASTVVGVGDYVDDLAGYGVGLAYNPNSGVMYARSFDNLYTVSLDDGSVTLVGPSQDFITGLTFDSAYSTLYSVGQGTGEFNKVDPATGTATIVDNMGIGTPLGLSTNSDGTVFTATISGDIYKVDTDSGDTSLVAPGVGGGLTEIAFDANDVLYGVTLTGDLLGTINLDTGDFNEIGPVGFSDVRGLAFVTGAGCYADCNDDGELNILDFVCFQLLFIAGDPAADCNGSGSLDILDFVCFQTTFQAGCP